MLVPVAILLVALALILDRDAIALVVLAVLGLLATQALSVRTKYLFVSDERAGIRYFGRMERSTERGAVQAVVGHAGQRLSFMGQRRRPLLIVNTADWADEEVARFLEALAVPVSWR